MEVNFVVLEVSSIHISNQPNGADQIDSSTAIP